MSPKNLRISIYPIITRFSDFPVLGAVEEPNFAISFLDPGIIRIEQKFDIY